MIPAFQKQEILDGRFYLGSHPKIKFQMDGYSPDFGDFGVQHIWDNLNRSFFAAGLPCTPYQAEPLILLEEYKSDNPEAYQMIILDSQITIRTCGLAGLRNALSSLSFLTLKAIEDKCNYLQAQYIEDSPAYPWRGLHLDVSRHFFGVQEIKKYLDWMFLLKLNHFHWHLSDDQGWRIQSRSFPLLTDKGAWRQTENGVYGGYYTQDEVIEIREYANIRGIMVIPEIDLPGHAMAMLAAYPELACKPRDFKPLDVWGISEDILCAGKDSTLEFLQELLLEMAELFPGKYLHIGGDEAPKQRWKECPHCQKRIRDKRLKNEEELQSWLIHQIQKPLQQAGKTLIGWDEILDGNLGIEPLVHVWRGDGIEAARKAAQNGNHYIISPNQLLYFDWRADPDPDSPGAHGVTSLEKVMNIDLKNYIFDKPELFLGGQANVWTEYMPDFATVKKMLFPRVFAMAELFWKGHVGADLKERIALVEGIF